MIYVTVGNHYRGFERLLKVVDDIAKRIAHKFIVQRGHSNIQIGHCQHSKYFTYDEAELLIRKADVVIGHSGIGTVISCRRARTPLIICPRLKKYDEHENDHQLQIASVAYEEKIQGVFPCEDFCMLEDTVQDILRMDLKNNFDNINPGAFNIANEINLFLSNKIFKTIEEGKN